MKCDAYLVYTAMVRCGISLFQAMSLITNVILPNQSPLPPMVLLTIGKWLSNVQYTHLGLRCCACAPACSVEFEYALNLFPGTLRLSNGDLATHYQPPRIQSEGVFNDNPSFRLNIQALAIA